MQAEPAEIFGGLACNPIVLADNLASLLCAATDEQHDLRARSHRCNRSYAAQLLPRVLPRILFFVGDELVSCPANTCKK